MTHIRFQSGLHSYLTIVIIIIIATIMIVTIMTHIFNNLGFYSSFMPSSAIITLFITIFLVIPPSKIIIIFFVSVLPPTESVVHQNDGNARSEFSVFISNSLQRNMCFFSQKGRLSWGDIKIDQLLSIMVMATHIKYQGRYSCTNKDKLLEIF